MDAQNHVFKALADPTRRAILEVLKKSDEPTNILQISHHFNMTRQAVSKHIRILKRAGLLKILPAGRSSMLTLESGPLSEVTHWLAGFDVEVKQTQTIDDLDAYLNSGS